MTITAEAVQECVAKGTVRIADDSVVFVFDALPKSDRSDLDQAEVYRLAWLESARHGAGTLTVKPSSQARWVRSTPELHAAVEWAVNMGARDPGWLALWLDIEPGRFDPGWFTRPAVDYLIRQGFGNTEIARISESVWGCPVKADSVKMRRHRLKRADQEGVAA